MEGYLILGSRDPTIRIPYFRKLPLGVWYKGSIGCSKYSMGFVQGFYGVL